MLYSKKIIFRHLLIVVVLVQVLPVCAQEDIPTSTPHAIIEKGIDQLPESDGENDVLFDPVAQGVVDDVSWMQPQQSAPQPSFLKRKIQEWAIMLFIQYILAKEKLDGMYHRVRRTVRSALFHL